MCGTLHRGVTWLTLDRLPLIVHTPTGAGKSSFLDCVSLRNQQFNGSVFVNGKPADESYYFMTGACACAWIEIELVVD